jgi:hypothetical protein
VDARRFSGPSQRNRDPILAVLRGIVPDGAKVIEVASGSGMHAVWFTARLSNVTWQPTDLDEHNMASIVAWREFDEVPGVLDPVVLDVTVQPWATGSSNVVYCANMIHIAPWSACLGLLDGAAEALDVGGALVLYGPYKRDGEHTAEGNARFDLSLRSRDASWGVRDLEVVQAHALARGLELERVVQMPVNNLILVFRRI